MIKPELTTWKGSIVGATGNQLHALGRISLPLRIGSWIRTKVFAVVENFPYEVLLGINVLHRSDIRLSKYTFRPHQGQKVPLRPPDLPPQTPVYTVNAGEVMVLPARQLSQVLVHVAGLFDPARESECLMFIGNIANKQNLYALTTIHTQFKHGYIKVGIMNPTSENITLQKRQLIGHLELADLLDEGLGRENTSEVDENKQDRKVKPDNAETATAESSFARATNELQIFADAK